MKNNSIKQGTTARVAALLLVIAVLIGSVLTAVSCSSGKNAESQSNYLTVSSGGERLEMKVTLTETGLDKVSLFAIEPWQTASSVSELVPLDEYKVKDNTVSVKYKIEGNLTEALCRGYVLAKKEGEGYKPVSGVYYVTNPRDVHKNLGESENIPLDSIKGAIGAPSQLIDLGASSTVVTVDLGKLLSPGGGIGTMSYIWNGYTCYVNRTAVEMLDMEIKSYSNAGIYVFLELVQTVSYDDLPEGLKSIAFRNFYEGDGYALNMTNLDGAVQICGVLDFLAGRYATGGENGKASAFIIGRNVNNYSKNYIGEETAELSAQNYMTAVRAAYSILMSHTPEGRVYVSVDNKWNVSNDNAREFLSTIAGMADDGGDFYWQIAIEANASDATLSSIWTDDLTGEHPQFLSPANIEVLSNILSTGQFTCNGMRRNILLNRFAVGGDNEDARAASYAYAFYKCLDAKNVDGLIYAKTADAKDDLLRNGLMTAGEGAKLPERKTIGDVFSSIDNVNDGQTNSLGSTVGSVWEKLYNDNKNTASRRNVTRAGLVVDSSKVGAVTLRSDFSGGDTFGFVPVASAEYTELCYSSYWNRPTLYTHFSSTVASGGAGVTTSTLKLKELRDAGFIGITALTMANGSSTADITIRLSGYTKDGTLKELVCIGPCTSNTWVDLFCDVSEFVKDIKSENITMTVLASSYVGNGSVDNLWLAQVMTAVPAKSGIPTWLLILIIVAVLLAAGAALYFFWFRKNYTFVREGEESDPKNKPGGTPKSAPGGNAANNGAAKTVPGGNTVNNGAPKAKPADDGKDKDKDKIKDTAKEAQIKK